MPIDKNSAQGADLSYDAGPTIIPYFAAVVKWYFFTKKSPQNVRGIV